MMTDRELLELAAKAARLELSWQDGWNGMPDLASCNGRVWNPLTDDGEALRLAVKLGLSVEQWPDEDGDGPYASVGNLTRSHEESGNPYLATRRVIVEAAAAIGKAMP